MSSPHEYGWRGPHEVALGAPRYADEPLLALSQMCAMAHAGDEFDPDEIAKEVADLAWAGLRAVQQPLLRIAALELQVFNGDPAAKILCTQLARTPISTRPGRRSPLAMSMRWVRSPSTTA